MDGGYDDLEASATTCSIDSESTDQDDSEDDTIYNTFVWEFLSDALKQQTNRRCLTLTNFVDRSHGARDALALSQLLGMVAQPSWRSIHFEDVVPGHRYRRWLFKKTGVYRYILRRSPHTAAIPPVTFYTRVEVDTTAMTPKAITSLLRELKKDLDVKSVSIRGKLKPRDAESVAIALVSLLNDPRGWQTVEFQVDMTSPASDDSSSRQRQVQSLREAQLIEKVCKRALQKVAAERYITLEVL
ncbi:expressed unknown protein [Seminavis robusta]|uniref:Uncharacterized protein n=1 Tax=Seminavis robusta TaxID=568900 RepID=A0A9N8DVC3_9STRA|nr:expressed unknown protein [Seminavis robusta]|eukprot:Sro321_g116630.1 n/a (243) ;mRNA; f:6060-6788